MEFNWHLNPGDKCLNKLYGVNWGGRESEEHKGPSLLLPSDPDPIGHILFGT